MNSILCCRILLFLSFTSGCIPQPVEDKKLICLDPNDPKTCPAKKVSIARNACNDAIAAEWSELEKVCYTPKSHQDCQNFHAKAIWSGDKCVFESDSYPTFYELCSDNIRYSDVQEDIKKISKAIGFKTCQENYDFLLQQKTIKLNRIELTSLRPFLGFRKLESLDLLDNKISDLSDISALKNLKHLNLGKNKIEDVTPLYQMLDLETLLLFENEILSAEVLLQLPSIKKLDLSFNRIKNLEFFQNATFEIFLDGNPKKNEESVMPIIE